MGKIDFTTITTNTDFWNTPPTRPVMPPNDAIVLNGYATGVNLLSLRNALQALACITLNLTTPAQRRHFYAITDVALQSGSSPEGMYEKMIRTAYEAKEMNPDEPE